MTGLILAAGTATRLRPITNFLPKALLEVGGKTIIDRQIETLLKEGIFKIVVVTGYHGDMLENHLKKAHPEAEFIFERNEDFERSSAAYSVMLALKHIDESVIYLNGDVIYEPKILKSVIESAHESATAIQKINWDEEQVNVTLNNDGAIKKIGKQIEARESDGEFIGVTKLSKEFVGKIHELVEKNGIETFRYNFAVDLLNKVIEKFNDKIFVIDVTKLEAIEIDTEDDLEKARSKFKNLNKQHEPD